METYKQLWIKENPYLDFDIDSGCRDYDLVHLGVIQKNCFSKKCSECWNEEVKVKADCSAGNRSNQPIK